MEHHQETLTNCPRGPRLPRLSYLQVQDIVLYALFSYSKAEIINQYADVFYYLKDVLPQRHIDVKPAATM